MESRYIKRPRSSQPLVLGFRWQFSLLQMLTVRTWTMSDQKFLRSGYLLSVLSWNHGSKSLFSRIPEYRLFGGSGKDRPAFDLQSCFSVEHHVEYPRRHIEKRCLQPLVYVHPIFMEYLQENIAREWHNDSPCRRALRRNLIVVPSYCDCCHCEPAPQRHHAQSTRRRCH